MSKQMQRDATFDIARAMGVLGVIIGHTLMGGHLNFLQNIIFEMNLPIFFFVSGYFYRNKKIMSLIKGGFNTLLFPYIILAIIWIILNYIKIPTLHTIKVFTIAAFYASGAPGIALFGDGNIAIGALWFLPAMFIGNILFHFIMKLKSHSLQIIFVLICVLLGFYLGPLYRFPLSLAAVLQVQLYYYAGHLWKNYRQKIENNWTYYLLICICATFWIVGALSGWYGLTAGTANHILLATLGGLGTPFILLLLAKGIIKFTTNFAALFKWIGQVSILFFIFNWLDIIFIDSMVNTHLLIPLSAAVSENAAYIIISLIRVLWSIIAVFIVLKFKFIRTIFLDKNAPLHM